jgi:hypothetical protein
MSAPHDEYKRLNLAPGQQVEPCPVCGADSELWQFSETETSPTRKLVMCSNGDPIGPQEGGGFLHEGCPLYMPNQGFYRSTIRDAVKYWNEFAKALQSQQRSRRWARANVLRKEAPASGGMQAAEAAGPDEKGGQA